MQEPSESLATHSHPEPDVAIRKAVGILTKARNSLDRIRVDKDQLDALHTALYEADAELGYAAWQVGTLKGQLRKERIAFLVFIEPNHQTHAAQLGASLADKIAGCLVGIKVKIVRTG